MKFELASKVRRPSRRPIVLPSMQSTRAQANNLAALYGQIVQAWAAGAVRILARYERTLDEMQFDSAEDIADAVDDVADVIRRLVLSLTPDLRRWALRVERVQRGKWVRSILSATDVDLTTILTAGDVEETLEAQLRWNIALIRDVSDEIRRRIANAVFSGLQQRQPPRVVGKEIAQATGMARKRANRIAADQAVKLGERLNRARQEQAGLTTFKWRHSGKEHPRSWHKARDGNIYPWEGSAIPKDDMPGVPPYCGCTAQGVVQFE